MKCFVQVTVKKHNLYSSITITIIGRSQLPVPVVQDIIHVLAAWLMQWNDRRKQWPDEGGELWHIAVRGKC